MSNLVDEHSTFKKSGGYFTAPKGVLKITGPDAKDFLHRITTQNIKTLMAGHGAPTALLQGNAMIISLFDLYHSGNFYLVVCDEPLRQLTFESLEKFHFAEDLEIRDISEEFKFVSVQGPRARESVAKALGRVPQERHEIIGTEEAFVMAEADFSTVGCHLLVKTEKFDEVKKKLESAGVCGLSLELWNLLRAESGHAKFGVDVNDKNLILEAALADHVSRDKGCYPGQEVVERVFTYGNVAKKLVGLEWPEGAEVPRGGAAKLLGDDNKEVGTVTSVQVFPWNKKAFGFAIVRKPFYEDGRNLRVSDAGTEVKVVSLPQSFEIKRELG